MRIGICCLALVINMIVFVLQIKVKSFLRTQYVFAVTLTIADIIHAAALVGETYLFRQNIFPIPIWYGAFAFASGLQSYLSILAVAYDRYLALCAIPLKYKLIITIRKYWVVILIMNAFCFTCGFVFFGLVSHQSVALTYTSFVYPIALMSAICIVYIRLAYLVSKSLKTLNFTVDIQRRRARQTKRLMIAFATILLAHVICNMPQRVFSLYISLQPTGRRYTVFEHVAIGNWLYNVQTINTCVNPVIYWKHVLSKDTKFPFASMMYRAICPVTCKGEPPTCSQDETESKTSSAVSAISAI
ncbi:Sphingosine 1-phosphate receptor 1 [Holothuria leucospilota]|uniref:Sphingosine 1-phosphate receptor 1 n=1 Tax=Holothuria leucospilota TaxID=206669 RepID=A0A9Q1CDP5_HOLLE|nr:Sphingosine 1-phosphate receptor 1 [Holothuria leucospilota]